MAEVHDLFAGRGEVLRRNLVEPAASLHHRAGLAQHGEVLGGHVRAAFDDCGQLAHHAWFAVAQFLEYFPPRRMAERRRQEIKAGQGFSLWGCLLVFWVIHRKNQGFMAIIGFLQEIKLLSE